MDPIEKEKLEKLLGKDYIERKAKRQVVSGKEGEEPIIDIRKVTGLDETGGITDAELDRIKIFDCGHPSEGRANLGGRCAICGALFCNRIVLVSKSRAKPACYRKCNWCHRLICMNHVRGKTDAGVYCSLRCYFFANPAILVLLGVVILIILFVIIKAVFH